MADYDPTLNAIVGRMKSPGWEDEARRYISAARPSTQRVFASEYEQWKFGATYQLTLVDPDDDQDITEYLSYNELLFRLKEYNLGDQFNELVWKMWGEYNGTGEGLPAIHTPYLDIFLEAV